MADPLITLRRGDAGAPVFQKIGIVGLGLIGGSIALAARQVWPGSLVIGVDTKDVLEAAMRRHAVDVGADDLVVLAEADVVVLAAPVRDNIRLLGELGASMPGEAIVTDTGSTKRAIVEAARALPARFTFVGGHPLGGAARGGLAHARPDLFHRRPWFLTPDEKKGTGIFSDGTPRENIPVPFFSAVDRLSRFVTALGATPRITTAAAHDRLLAYLSHLPQLTASALMAVVGEAAGAEGLALAGRGLVDTTRLASSPPGIWRDVAATNADDLAAALDALIAVLQDLRRDLPGGDRLSEIFAAAARWRARLPTL